MRKTMLNLYTAAVIGTTLGALVALPVPAIAQAWELNAHTGAADDAIGDGSQFVLGTGILRHLPGGWAIGGTFDWAPVGERRAIPAALVNDQFDAEVDMDLDVYTYAAQIEYGFSVSERTWLAFDAGLGGATTRISYLDVFTLDDELAIDAVEQRVEASQTQWMVPVGGSLRLLNRALDPSWALRLGVRDQILLEADEPVIAGAPNETTHALQFTAGVSLFW